MNEDQSIYEEIVVKLLDGAKHTIYCHVHWCTPLRIDMGQKFILHHAWMMSSINISLISFPASTGPFFAIFRANWYSKRILSS